jgi:hypothetical protein
LTDRGKDVAEPEDSVPAATLGSASAEIGQPAPRQLRHADGGALAQRVYIHQLPQTAPGLAELIEDVFGPAARDTPSMSAVRPAEGT